MRKALCLLAGLMAATLLTQMSYGDTKGEIKYRKSVMEAVGGHMGAMAAILRNQVHSDELAFHADAMAKLSKLVPNIFPEGSGEGKTEAKAEIWQDPEAFKAAMDKFVTAANGMSEVAASGDMKRIGPAIKALGGSCKGCHDDFQDD